MPHKCKAVFYLAEAVYCLCVYKPNTAIALSNFNASCWIYSFWVQNKSLHLTSPYNNSWFIVLEKWNNKFSVLSQSLRVFIGFSHSPNKFALFSFHSSVHCIPQNCSCSFHFPSFIWKTKKAFTLLQVTLYLFLYYSRPMWTPVTWTSGTCVVSLFPLS